MTEFKKMSSMLYSKQSSIDLNDLFAWATSNGAEISSKLFLQGVGSARRLLTTDDISEGEQVT